MAQKDLAAKLLDDEEKRRKRMIRGRIIGAVLVLLALIGGFVWQWLYSRSHAEPRLEVLNSRAHTIRLVIDQWEWRGNPVEAGIGQIAGDGDALHEYLLYYFGEQEGHWYGIACDDSGAITYTVCSEKPLTDEILAAPPDREKILRLLKSPFPWTRAKAAGVWYTDDTLNVRWEAEQENETEITE